ncbi:MAG: hypothetical protein IV090_19320 [Candidatus Sericytochromatia bacterium]|nr:hypothetical protein [Candidatus Sericytochromatia bacterium]
MSSLAKILEEVEMLTDAERISVMEKIIHLLKHRENRSAEVGPSFLDLAGDAVGGLKNCPPDLSSNPVHMQGFGR